MSAPATSRRTFLTAGVAAVTAGGATGVIAASLPTDPDLIFALIETEKAAFRRCDAATIATDGVALGREANADETAEYDAAWASHSLAYEAMISAMPTTTAGLVALLDRFETYTAEAWSTRMTSRPFSPPSAPSSGGLHEHHLIPSRLPRRTRRVYRSRHDGSLGLWRHRHSTRRVRRGIARRRATVAAGGRLPAGGREATHGGRQG